MKHLWDKTQLKNIEFKNRFIRSALHEGKVELDYEKLAKGGISTIITGFAYVLEGAPASPGMIEAYDDRFIEEFQKHTEAVHKHGANIVLQLAECGSQAKINVKKRTIYGPSAVEHKYTHITPIEMTEDDIKRHVNAFGDAAVRAKKAGFDAVQLHAAHGYLISQFLTPYYNRRDDKYGGSIENRARFIFEIYENMREKVGDDFPIFIKINCSDFMGDEGLSFEESKFICKKLDEMGIDLIEISGNVAFNPNEPDIIRPDIHKDPDKQCYFAEYARVIADEVSAPVAVVGGNRNIEKMEEILNNSNISYFLLARTILCEADLINKWQENPEYEPKCISCNKCFSLKGNICIFNK